jgi:hypothetical protein
MLVEPAKSIAMERFRGNGPLAYMILMFYQAVLLADTLHAHVNDWWIWLLATFRIGNRVTAAEIAPGSSFPWLSFTAAVAIGIAWFWTPAGNEPTPDQGGRANSAVAAGQGS